MFWRVIPFSFAAIWSTGYTVAGIVIPHGAPFTFLALRYAVAFVLLAPLALAFRARWPETTSGWLHAILSGALLHGGYQGGFWWAMQHGVPGGIAALIAALQPIFTALAVGPLIGERLTPARWLGVALGFVGVALVLAPKLQGAGFGEFGLPIFAAVLGTVAVTAATLHQKRALDRFDLKALAPIQFIGAVAVTLPVALLAETPSFETTPAMFFALGWAVLVLSIAAPVMMMLLIERGAVSRVAAVIYLIPPLASIQTYLFFGETLSLVQLAGMGVAAVGVLLATRADGGKSEAAAH